MFVRSNVLPGFIVNLDWVECVYTKKHGEQYELRVLLHNQMEIPLFKGADEEELIERFMKLFAEVEVA